MRVEQGTGLDCFIPWGPVLRVEGQFPLKRKWIKEKLCSCCFAFHTPIVSGNASYESCVTSLLGGFESS